MMLLTPEGSVQAATSQHVRILVLGSNWSPAEADRNREKVHQAILKQSSPENIFSQWLNPMPADLLFDEIPETKNAHPFTSEPEQDVGGGLIFEPDEMTDMPPAFHLIEVRNPKNAQKLINVLNNLKGVEAVNFDDLLRSEHDVYAEHSGFDSNDDDDDDEERVHNKDEPFDHLAQKFIKENHFAEQLKIIIQVAELFGRGLIPYEEDEHFWGPFLGHVFNVLDPVYDELQQHPESSSQDALDTILDRLLSGIEGGMNSYILPNLLENLAESHLFQRALLAPKQGRSLRQKLFNHWVDYAADARTEFDLQMEDGDAVLWHSLMEYDEDWFLRAAHDFVVGRDQEVLASTQHTRHALIQTKGLLEYFSEATIRDLRYFTQAELLQRMKAAQQFFSITLDDLRSAPLRNATLKKAYNLLAVLREIDIPSPRATDDLPEAEMRVLYNERLHNFKTYLNKISNEMGVKLLFSRCEKNSRPRPL